MRKLLAAASVISLCMISAASAAETINMWVRSGIGDSFKKVVEAYNSSHENKVAMTEVPFSELVQKYATAIAGGQAPDAMSLDLIYTPAFAAAGQLEDLTDWAKSLPYYSSLSPSHVEKPARPWPRQPSFITHGPSPRGAARGCASPGAAMASRWRISS